MDNFRPCFVLDAKMLQLNNDTKLVKSAKEAFAKKYTFRNDLNVVNIDYSIINNNSIKGELRSYFLHN